MKTALQIPESLGDWKEIDCTRVSNSHLIVLLLYRPSTDSYILLTKIEYTEVMSCYTVDGACIRKYYYGNETLAGRVLRVCQQNAPLLKVLVFGSHTSRDKYIKEHGPSDKMILTLDNSIWKKRTLGKHLEQLVMLIQLT